MKTIYAMAPVAIIYDDNGQLIRCEITNKTIANVLQQHRFCIDCNGTGSDFRRYPIQGCKRCDGNGIKESGFD